MSRMQDSRERTEQYRDFAQAVDAEPEDTNNASGLQEVPPAPAATDSMTRDSVLAGCSRRTWTLDPETMLLFTGREPARGTEEFRALRSRLYQLQGKSPLKSLLIVSAVAGEGKSFVAGNLARVMALQPECRVLLIDADLRRPRLHSALGTSSTPGFSEYLLQEADEFGVMQRSGEDNLFFIPSGRTVAGPTELIANGRLKSLIDRVEPLFDWIIVDSPAAVPVSDACLLANYCDGVLMVVRSNSTPFDIVRQARARFHEESLIGVVLNVIEPHSSHGVRSSSRNPNSEVRVK